MAEKMKALVVRAPMQFGIEQVDRPAAPAGGLLLKILACGLCGSDLRTLRSGHRKVRLPYIIGHEIAAEVFSEGQRYRGPWKPGDRLAVSPLVYCGSCYFCNSGTPEYCLRYREIAQAWPGGFAEFMALPPEAVTSGTIQPVPSGMDPVHTTLAEPLSSCVNAQEKGAVGKGDTVLIIGAGPVGTLHLELARARGAEKVIIADISASRLERMAAHGPDRLIDVEKQDLREEVMKETGRLGPSVVITANSDPSTQVTAVELARKGGRILLFGGLPADRAKPGINMNTVHYRGLQLIGTTIFSPAHQREAMRLLTGGRIPAGKIISHRFPLAEFEEAARLALDGKTMKTVFIP